MSALQLVRHRHFAAPSSEPPSPVRNYECEYLDCSKAFARKSDLQRHMRIHTNDRPFKCEYRGCEKSFIQKSALNVHERTHTGERPHKCEECRKAFADSSSLARHRRIHTGDKPYQCFVIECGKQFCRKITLTRHYKSSHPDVAPPVKYRLPNGISASLRMRQRMRKASIYSSSPSSASSSPEESPAPHTDNYAPHGSAAPYPSRVAARLDGRPIRAVRRAKLNLDSASQGTGAYLTYAYPPDRAVKLEDVPKLMPWQSQNVGGFQPDQLAIPHHQGQYPIGLGRPIQLRLEKPGEETYSPSPSPELALVDIAGYYPPTSASSSLLVATPLSIDHRDGGHFSLPAQRYHSPSLNVQVVTANWAAETGMYTPQTALFDGGAGHGHAQLELDEPCQLAYTPLDGQLESSQSLWGPEIHYPAVSTGTSASADQSPLSCSSTLYDGRSFSSASSTTIAPMALSPCTNFEPKLVDGAGAIPFYPAYSSKLQGYYTPITPAPDSYWSTPAQSYATEPAPMQRVLSDTGGIGLGISNVSLGDSNETYETYEEQTARIRLEREELARKIEMDDSEPVLISVKRERSLEDSDDEDGDDEHFRAVDQHDDDPDYVEERPRNRKRRSRR